jgi:hypothetical protein
MTIIFNILNWEFSLKMPQWMTQKTYWRQLHGRILRNFKFDIIYNIAANHYRSYRKYWHKFSSLDTVSITGLSTPVFFLPFLFKMFPVGINFISVYCALTLIYIFIFTKQSQNEVWKMNVRNDTYTSSICMCIVYIPWCCNGPGASLREREIHSDYQKKSQLL